MKLRYVLSVLLALFSLNVYSSPNSANMSDTDLTAEIQKYSKAVNKNPNDVGALRNRALTAAKIVAKYPRSAVHVKATPLAGTYSWEGKEEHFALCYRAIDDLDKSTELEPSFIPAYALRGEFLFEVGEYQKSIDDLTYARQHNTKDMGRAHLYRARDYRELKNEDKALSDFAAAAKIDPNNQSIFLERSGVYKERGEEELADADMGRLAEILISKWNKNKS